MSSYSPSPWYDYVSFDGTYYDQFEWGFYASGYGGYYWNNPLVDSPFFSCNALFTAPCYFGS